MNRITRRTFVKAGVAGTVAAIAGTKSSGRVIGANDTVRLAICGLNSRGGDHIKEFATMPGVSIAYLVDPDTRTYAKRQKQLRDLKCPEAKVVQDVREVLASKDVDAITIATPNHWHALMTIWACQAGKDVYVEKPCSHNIHEGRVAVDAVRKHGRIVQHGTQRRAWKSYQNLAAVVRSGHYGPLRVSRGIVYKLRMSIGNKPAADPPPEVNFDLWTGPAPLRPYHGNLVHYNWHWFWDFGNGDIGNQGVHQMDTARWMIPDAKLPQSVFAIGGRFGYTDQGETPNTQLAIYDYGETKLIFEVRGLPTPKYPNDVSNEGLALHFDDGAIVDFKFFRKGGDPRGEALPKMDISESNRVGGDSIFANFIACVRSRKSEQLCADIMEGHVSSALCHLGNMSYRLGHMLDFHPLPKVIDGIPPFVETYGEMEKHLVSAAKINSDTEKIRMGRVLNLDGERIANDDAANAMLTRNYRAPFAVPDKA
jgi:predicted dehydrogenase